MTKSAVELARRVGEALSIRGWTIATAESCTGGLLGDILTDIAGSSAYFVGGIVAYSNAVKQTHLGVSQATLASEGAVSDATVRAMAQGARERLQADVGIATTGIAGPGGGTATKPVGLVYICVTTPTTTVSQHFVFTGDRRSNKLATAEAALEFVLNVLE